MGAHVEMSFAELLILLAKACVAATALLVFGAGLGLGWLIWG